MNTASCSTNPGGSHQQNQTEECDGLDNDCDAATDEDFTYQGLSIGEDCDGVGECGTGTVECSGTSAADCSTNPGGSSPEDEPEVCDGKDNDCDGVDDDGIMCLPGDANRDCKVDIFDLAIVGRAYGTMPGSPWWDVRADVDWDGAVGILDLATVGMHFRNTC